MDLLDQDNLVLGCYPTSAFTTTLGGWIGTGGHMGIGTLQNGSFIEQIVALKVVTPTGELILYDNKKDFSHFFGGNGIFGIVTEVFLKVYPKPERQIPLLFGFENITDQLNSMKELIAQTDPFLIRFSDKYHEYNCSGLSRYSHYIFLLYNGRNNYIDDDIERCHSILNANKGRFLGEEISERTWDDYLKHELKIKLETPVQMLQQLMVDIHTCERVLNYFDELVEKYKVNHCFYGLINKDLQIRLCLYTPTDNNYWLHFLSSKAVLNEVVKYIYKNNGRIYTYGLQNTVYLHKFEKEKLKEFQEKKLKLDPNYILNPLKIVKTKMSFRRLNVMFKLAMLWRRLALRIGIAHRILTLDI